MTSPEPPQEPKQARGGPRFYILFAVLLLVHVAGNLWWLARDNHVIRVDEEFHLRRAADYFLQLFAQDGASLAERIQGVLAIKTAYPPLAYFVGSLFAGLFGYSTDIITASGTVLLLLIILGAYAIARQWMERWPALFAAYVTGFLPLVFGLSRFFTLDYFGAAIIVWAMYCLLKSNRFLHTGWVLAFAALNGLGCLAKQSTPIFLLTPSLGLAALGLCAAVRGNTRHAGRPAAVAHVVVNMALTAVVTVGVFAPWYALNLDVMREYWLGQHAWGQGVFAAQPLEATETDQAETHAPDAAAAVPQDAPTAVAAAPPPEAAPPETDAAGPIPLAPDAPQTVPPAPEQRPWDTFSALAGKIAASLGAVAAQSPRIWRDYWDYYPLFTINTGTFLPAFVLAALGLLTLARRQNRTLPVAVCLLWLLGAYVLLTLLFNARTARYLVGALPVFAILSTMALEAIPNALWRRTAMAAYAAYLLFVYVNLTFLPYDRAVKAHLPVLRNHPVIEWIEDDGLALCSNRLVTGVYVAAPPYTGENSAERVLRAIAAAEQRRQAPAGNVARYQVVSRTNAQMGLAAVERHYDPAPNALRPLGFDPLWESPRPIRSLGPEVRQPSEAEPVILNADYVVLKPGNAPDVDDRIAFWAAHMSSFGFETVDHFFDAAAGRYKPGWVHVMSRQEPITLDSAQDFFDYAELKSYTGTPWAVPREKEAALNIKLAAAAASFRDRLPLCEELTLMNVSVTRIVEGWYRLRIAFKVERPIDGDWRVYVYGHVREQDAARLPERFRPVHAVSWNFTPYPPTSQWQPGEYVVVGRSLMAEPIAYRISLGLYRKEGQEDLRLGNPVSIARPIDFRLVPPEHPDWERPGKP